MLTIDMFHSNSNFISFNSDNDCQIILFRRHRVLVIAIVVSMLPRLAFEFATFQVVVETNRIEKKRNETN